jgi:hypothetical protein
VAAAGQRWLAARTTPHGTKAIILDVDDTTLSTWNYEIFSNWAFNPPPSDSSCLDQRFPAVPGMVDMGPFAQSHGYAIFFLTGRAPRRRTATLGNLTSDGLGVDAGYPGPTTLSQRRGRPLHQAGRGQLPRLPEGRLPGRPERHLHDAPLQVGHPGAHRVARLRHRGQLRATSSATSRAGTPTAPSSCRTPTTSCPKRVRRGHVIPPRPVAAVGRWRLPACLVHDVERCLGDPAERAEAGVGGDPAHRLLAGLAPRE